MCQNVNLSDLLVLDVLRDDPVLSFLAAPEDEPTAKKYCISALIAAAETHGLSGNLLPRYLLHVLTSRANLVSETMERTDLPPGTSLRDVFYHDIRLLYPLLTAPTSIFLGETLLDNYEPTRNIYGKTEARRKNTQKFFLLSMPNTAMAILPPTQPSVGISPKTHCAEL